MYVCNSHTLYLGADKLAEAAGVLCLLSESASTTNGGVLTVTALQGSNWLLSADPGSNISVISDILKPLSLKLLPLKLPSKSANQCVMCIAVVWTWVRVCVYLWVAVTDPEVYGVESVWGGTPYRVRDGRAVYHHHHQLDWEQ